ncbi:AarF/ABC1/UbiB kinase family protein [Marivita sp. GX14005]|uniref:ABC1 kinase family protein n=1 Tax=Marivita sp. GX14005 TaxID=2942276 RepID=UPI002018CABB|nr:AarF/ABC1/UbiB kinase family protein [Marivita sp. GX14005]MCL3881041.1 AarF/ABC1/UbiB kinase family protein [Marivita sp. GX14005]
MTRPTDPRSRPVPTGRAARALRMGGMTGGLLGSAALSGAKQLLNGKRPAPRDLLLTPGNARRLTAHLSHMRGAAMKFGQLLSLEAGDMLTPELAAILAPLQAQAHIMPPKQLKRVLSDAWGNDFTRRFKRFDPRPIAAASIGQVHRAQTRDGRDLAIKVQYPGIRDSIDSDLRNLATLLRASNLLPRDIPLDSLFEEARQQLHEEADYAAEAKNLSEFGTLLSDDPHFTVPRLEADLSAPSVLVMEFIPSELMSALERADQSTRDAMAERLITLFMREVFEFGFVQSDPNFANFRWQPERGKIVLLDFGAARRIPDTIARNAHHLLRSALSGNLEEIEDALEHLGLLDPAMPQDARRDILALVELANPPLLDANGFDFGQTALVAELRQKGIEIGRDRRVQHIPPIDMLFLQRKAAGLFLLATRLGAKVDLRALFERYA